MMMTAPMDFREKVVFRLRSLYDRYGYSQYKMSKFEEYDLYARNKDFLFSDSVITFTDLDGKLMALKPDVTLSIVKNSKDSAGSLQKLYYNENVYRAAKSTRAFKETMQVGLECLGQIDDFVLWEVLTLAAESLRSISPDSILDISHLGLLSEIIDRMGVPEGRKDAILKRIGEKNIHELTALCRDCGVSGENIEVLKELVTTCGAPGLVLPKLQGLLPKTPALDQLSRVIAAMKGSRVEGMLRFDFSAVDDIHYYNGIVFKGFIHGLPGSVLSGGQYDNLMKKMHRSSGAIGFAVYMDMLERLEESRREFDVDNLLLYGEGESLAALRAQVDALTGQGESVMVQRCIPENIRYKRLWQLRNGEVETLENNA